MPLVRALVRRDGTPLWRQRGRAIEVVRCGYSKGVPKWIKVAHLLPREQLVATYVNRKLTIKGPFLFLPASMSGVIVRCSIAAIVKPRTVIRYTETNVVTARPVLNYIDDEKTSFDDLRDQWESYYGFTPPKRIHTHRPAENSPW
jgi:hypothetical protein